MRKIIILGLAVLTLAGYKEARAADWTLDTAHSRVGFSVPHLGISKVNGQFKDYSAELSADPASGKVTALKATVKIASVDTTVEARDNHLRSADFFDAATFPQMVFALNEAKWNGKALTLSGLLTIKGVSKKVEFKGEFRGPQKINMGAGDQLRSGYALSTVINRQDFGLSFNKVVDAVSLVGDEVTILLDIELYKPLTPAP